MTSNYQQHVMDLVRGMQIAALGATDLYAEPLTPATTLDGNELPAESAADRHAAVYDRLQADMVYVLLTTAPDMAQLLDYIQFSARALTGGREWIHIMPPPAPPLATSASSDANTAGPWCDDVRIVWSVPPDVYFAALEEKGTL